jgi:choline dehydrogenase-like flavoprotein
VSPKYDCIVVGTGFASSFFLLEYLAHARPDERILVLERGRHDPHEWQIRMRRNSSLSSEDTFVNRTPEKPWFYTPGFGGGSNCWWGVTPRMLPADFRTASTYGVGTDWPLDYDDLEPFYQQAETVMSISGPSDDTPFRRSAPYPQPPHRFSDPDRLLAKGFPGLYFHQPTARARRATAKRPACCATGVCHLCPVNAKFTIPNDLGDLHRDPRVTLLLEATALEIETRAGRASAVTYRKDGAPVRAEADLVVLGANALFNPHLLQRSGLDHPRLGRGLNEQVSASATLYLDGLASFQGSTSITGHGYMFYDGPHRAERAGCLVEAWNAPPNLRAEPGRWRERLDLKFIFEDLPSQESFVSPDPQRPELPEVRYHGPSSYAQRGLDQVHAMVDAIAAVLPVEDSTVRYGKGTEAHIQGTTPMGDDPATSVVDRHLVHHQVRNLLVLGSSSFPTCPPANPTLTIAALSLRSARRLRT